MERRPATCAVARESPASLRLCPAGISPQGCREYCSRHLATLMFDYNGTVQNASQVIDMKKFIWTGLIVVGGVLVLAASPQAAPRYQSQGSADNARAACILPWYRFFGACDEAISDPPDGRNWHDWQNRGRHHGHYRR